MRAEKQPRTGCGHPTCLRTGDRIPGPAWVHPEVSLVGKLLHLWLSRCVQHCRQEAQQEGTWLEKLGGRTLQEPSSAPRLWAWLRMAETATWPRPGWALFGLHPCSSRWLALSAGWLCALGSPLHTGVQLG